MGLLTVVDMRESMGTLFDEVSHCSDTSSMESNDMNMLDGGDSPSCFSRRTSTSKPGFGGCPQYLYQEIVKYLTDGTIPNRYLVRNGRNQPKCFRNYFASRNYRLLNNLLLRDDRYVIQKGHCESILMDVHCKMLHPTAEYMRNSVMSTFCYGSHLHGDLLADLEKVVQKCEKCRLDGITIQAKWMQNVSLSVIPTPENPHLFTVDINGDDPNVQTTLPIPLPEQETEDAFGTIGGMPKDEYEDIIEYCDSGTLPEYLRKATVDKQNKFRKTKFLFVNDLLKVNGSYVILREESQSILRAVHLKTDHAQAYRLGPVMTSTFTYTAMKKNGSFSRDLERVVANCEICKNRAPAPKKRANQSPPTFRVSAVIPTPGGPNRFTVEVEEMSKDANKKQTKRLRGNPPNKENNPVTQQEETTIVTGRSPIAAAQDEGTRQRRSLGSLQNTEPPATDLPAQLPEIRSVEPQNKKRLSREIKASGLLRSQRDSLEIVKTEEGTEIQETTASVVTVIPEAITVAVQATITQVRVPSVEAIEDSSTNAQQFTIPRLPIGTTEEPFVMKVEKQEEEAPTEENLIEVENSVPPCFVCTPYGKIRCPDGFAPRLKSHEVKRKMVTPDQGRLVIRAFMERRHPSKPIYHQPEVQFDEVFCFVATDYGDVYIPDGFKCTNIGVVENEEGDQMTVEIAVHLEKAHFPTE